MPGLWDPAKADHRGGSLGGVWGSRRGISCLEEGEKKLRQEKL